MTEVKLISFASAPPPVMPPMPYTGGAYTQKKMGIGTKLAIGGAAVGLGALAYHHIKKVGNGNFKEGLKTTISDSAKNLNGLIDKIGKKDNNGGASAPPKV
jgi:hypothetical protein